MLMNSKDYDEGTGLGWVGDSWTMALVVLCVQLILEMVMDLDGSRNSVMRTIN